MPLSRRTLLLTPAALAAGTAATDKAERQQGAKLSAEEQFQQEIATVLEAKALTGKIVFQRG